MISSTSHTLQLDYEDYRVIISQESPGYENSSEDNDMIQTKHIFGEGYHPSSRYKVDVILDDAMLTSSFLIADGGATGIHESSAFIIESTCFLAIGPFICALNIPTLDLLWHTKADSATCFGIYSATNYNNIISHGELEIARLDYSGKLIWSSSGKDIFSESFYLSNEYAEVEDFNNTKYKVDLETGEMVIVSE